MDRRRLNVLIAAVLCCVFLALMAVAAWAAPANDDFDNAREIVGGQATVYGGNTEATTETGEPFLTSIQIAGEASVWWRWVAPASGVVTIDTEGSDFDTVLGVYTGTAATSLTAVAENDDATATVLSSEVTFSAVKDTWYSIGVGGASGSPATMTGNIVLTVSQKPNNDMFSAATVVADPSGHVYATGYTDNCTIETGEPQVIPRASAPATTPGSGATVWYSYTPPFSGPVIIHLGGSTFDTVLGVYTGSAVGALTAVATNDDAFYMDGPSQVSIVAVAGTTYRIMVGGTPTRGVGSPPTSFVPDTGRYVLQIDPVVATPVFTPAEGTYAYPVTASISCSTPGAAIKYTTDGSEPTEASTTYTAPIALSANTPVKARAFKAGWTASDGAAASFRVRCAMSTPTLSPARPRRLHRFTITGFVRPRVGGKTAVYIERRVGRFYKPFVRVAATNRAYSTYTRYTSSRLAPRAGLYRMQARFSDSSHAPAMSAWRYFTVR